MANSAQEYIDQAVFQRGRETGLSEHGLRSLASPMAGGSFRKWIGG